MESSGKRNTGEWCEFPAGLEAVRRKLNIGGYSLTSLISFSIDDMPLEFTFDEKENLILNGSIVLTKSEYDEMFSILEKGLKIKTHAKSIPEFDYYWNKIG
ncbi:MAG: hypothetical protein VX277_01525, partial [Candidatus Thermoplasmatota archaeon]|nr:hypothetical protein [Candidatus Thermoplasmatota archaeon]